MDFRSTSTFIHAEAGEVEVTFDFTAATWKDAGVISRSVVETVQLERTGTVLRRTHT